MSYISRDSALAPPGRTSVLAVLRHLDYVLAGMVVLITLVGLWLLRGATVDLTGALATVADKQTFFFAIALGMMALLCLVDYRWINRAGAALYVLNLGALVAVLVAGQRVNGARSWIDLGPFNWQPAETMKIATVIVLAQWLALNTEKLQGWTSIIVPGVICGVPALLILMQPDLGSASLFFLFFLTMMLMAGVDRRHLALIVGAALLGMVSLYPFLKPYQKARLIVFVNPEADAKGSGYNVIQSKIAVGNGGFAGQGWGEGTQALHRFLPEHHTDFIFAASIEQIGFLGGMLLLGGYLIVFWRLIRAMDEARDRFGGLLVAGMTAILAGHLVENVGMTMGVLPVTGIPLPLFSYGGSFLVSTYAIFGLVLNVASRRYTFVGL